MKRLILIGLAALFLPAAARAMTLQNVIDLARAHVGDEVIMSQIEAAGEVFTLTVQDILDLKQAGVSDRVITYMINTGKNMARPEAVEPEMLDPEEDGKYDRYDRYHTSVDTYYRDRDDPTWNVYLSWGFGRYYDPWYWNYWPSYYWYYYPSTWYQPYWHYTPYYPVWHGRHHDGRYQDRRIKDGRHIGDRGRPRDYPVYRSYDRPGKSQPAPGTGPSREFKRRPADSPGNAQPPSTPPSQPGRTMKKPPPQGSRGDARQAPPPALGDGGRSGRQAPPPAVSGGGRSGRGSAPPPTSSSGRTMKKS